MNALLQQLAELNVNLALVDGQLKINAPKGVLTADLVAQLKQHKAEIVELLQAKPNSQTASRNCPGSR